MEISHVIFDLDGLLMDTEDLYSKAYQAALDPFGKEYTFDFKLKLMGSTEKDCARIVVEGYQLPISPEEFLESLQKEQDKILDQAEWMTGTVKLVHHLYKHKIPLAIATSSADGIFQIKTARHSKMLTFFKHVVVGTDPDLKHGKPAPDIYLLAAKRFGDGVTPEKCLALEDSANGVLSARAASMQAVMIPDPRLPASLRSSASLVLASAHDFDPAPFGLPAFSYRRVTHVIFDLDGTLLNTGDMCIQVQKDILSAHGKTFDPELTSKILGRRLQDNVELILKHYELPLSKEEFMATYGERASQVLPHAEFLPGTVRLLEHLARHKVPVAVATSASDIGVRAKLSRHQEKVKQFFSHIVNGSDAELKRGKPAPDIFKLAADRFPSPPSSYEDCLVFEDAPNGIAAAKAAGMQSVLIPDGDVLEASLTAEATQMLATMADFRPEDFGLPPFDDDSGK